MARVAITQKDEIGAAIQEAMGHFEIEPLVRDRVVAVKPNETWASDEDTSGVTQPDTLRAVLQYVRQFDPKELIVTGGSGAAETDDVFRIAGLMEVVQQEQAVFFDHNRGPFVEVDLEYAPSRDVEGPQKSVMVNKQVLEYETLIALNQLKLHATATVTLALKNVAMSYPAADYYGHPRKTEKNPNHFFEDMHSFIAAMAKRFPIDFAITVGHPAMIATGPLGGLPVETGLVIASDDPLAADVVGARLLGFGIQAVRHLWEASRLGIGDSDIDSFEFPALDLVEGIQRFTEAAYGRRMTYQHV